MLHLILAIILVSCAILLAVWLGVGLLLWLDAAARHVSTATRNTAHMLLRRGVPIEYAIPVGLALLPVVLLVLVLLR